MKRRYRSVLFFGIEIASFVLFDLFDLVIFSVYKK
jgi:hypothetical protein